MNYPFPHSYQRRDPIAKLLLCPSEDDVQKVILDWLNHQGIMAWAVDAGAKALRGRAVGLAKRLGADKGMLAAMNAGRAGAAQKGVVDIMGVLPNGCALILEVKQPEWLMTSKATGKTIQKKAPGQPTEEQLAFLNMAYQHGAVVGVVWSLEDVKEILSFPPCADAKKSEP